MSSFASSIDKTPDPTAVMTQRVIEANTMQANVTNAVGTNFTNAGVHMAQKADLGAQATELHKAEQGLMDPKSGFTALDIAGGMALGIDAATGGSLTFGKIATSMAIGGFGNGAIASFQNSKSSKTEGSFDLDGDDNDSFAASLEPKPKEVVVNTAPIIHPNLDQQEGFTAELEAKQAAALEHVRQQKALVLGAQAHQMDNIQIVQGVYGEQQDHMRGDLSYEDNVLLNNELQDHKMITPAPGMA